MVVLASGAGTLFAALATGLPTRSVVALVTDRPCPAQQHAARLGITTREVTLGDYHDRNEWDIGLTETVTDFGPDLVVTAGFMRILGPAFLTAFGGRVINSHPSLLPAFPGARAVPDALAYGVAVTGCTVHLVDAGVDTGPILAQRAVSVIAGDTVEVLHERIKTVERQLLIDVVSTVLTRGVRLEGRKATLL